MGSYQAHFYKETVDPIKDLTTTGLKSVLVKSIAKG